MDSYSVHVLLKNVRAISFDLRDDFVG